MNQEREMPVSSSNPNENDLKNLDSQVNKENISTEQKTPDHHNPKWINNEGLEVEQVFGFNKNAELVNGRVAMVGFLMLVITELYFSGVPVTKSIFGIG